MHDITGNVKENYARSGRLAGTNVGTTLIGRAGARMAMATGALTRADVDKQIVDTNSRIKSSTDALYSRAGAEMMKKRNRRNF